MDYRLTRVNPPHAPSPCPCPLLRVCCLHASQARLARAVLRVCAPSSALSRAPVHAARGDVRLVGGGAPGINALVQSPHELRERPHMAGAGRHGIGQRFAGPIF